MKYDDFTFSHKFPNMDYCLYMSCVFLHNNHIRYNTNEPQFSDDAQFYLEF